MSTAHSDNHRYRIWRFFKDKPSQPVKGKRGLTLEEAQRHCNDPSTKSDDWFDGYRRDPDSE